MKRLKEVFKAEWNLPDYLKSQFNTKGNNNKENNQVTQTSEKTTEIIM